MLDPSDVSSSRRREAMCALDEDRATLIGRTVAAVDGLLAETMEHGHGVPRWSTPRAP